MKKIGVVIPVMNQFELSIKALESVQVDGHYTWQPFIIPNWNENIGVAGAWNTGTLAAINAGCQYILIINDDIVLAPHTVMHMASLLDSDETIGVISATDHRNTYTPEQVRTLDFPGYDTEFLDAPDFACFMFKVAAYRHIGEFDTGFFPAYFEDNDYCYRTILSGLKCIRSQNAVFYHYGSRTQNHAAPVVPSPVFNLNRDYFIQKWGSEPGREVYTHPWNDENLSWQDTKKA